MRLLRVLLPVLLALTTLTAVSPAQADMDNDCRKVSARGVGQDLGGGNTTATITKDKLLKGTSAGHFEITGGEPPVFTIAGVVDFTTENGTLTVNLAGTFDVASGDFRTSGPITGGTGRFEGASGDLVLVGNQDPTGRFVETIKGNICLSDDHR